jgi:RNA polymerase sigma factor (sigma-70 family)
MSSVDREQRFNRLVHEHGDALHRYLRRRHTFRDAVDVEDLLSEIFAVAWKRLDDIPQAAELPWLYAVARRQLANARRRGGRRERIGASLRPPAPAPSAEDEAVADVALIDALASLAEGDREVLMLAAWEGLAPDELGAALGISVNAGAVRLSKAKTKLLALLAAPSTESMRTVATGTST